MNVKKPFETDEARWTALEKRDREADGFFYYGVTSTSIVCRPGCSSRLPLRSNVVFFNTCQDALNQGFRPCKRCKPEKNNVAAARADLVIQACRHIEQAENPPTLMDLAERAGLSSSHFHRLFKKIVGVTPKQYTITHQVERFRNNILSGHSVTEAIYQSGFSSSSRAYEKSNSRLGMKPGDLKKGGAAIAIKYGISRCFLGWVIVAASNRGICCIEFGDSPDEVIQLMHQRFPKARLINADEGFNSLINEIVGFIKQPNKDFQIPLDIQGTVFQQKVWAILREIKPGRTKSYSDIAKQLGNPQAVRAVARACAANKLAVVIPCHRVIAKDGRISGYRWGVDRKKLLLENEALTISPEKS